MQELIITIDHTEHWRERGSYYGYPKCCIDAFIKPPLFKKLSKEQNAVHKNHGFIPCKECAKKVYGGETTIEGLIKNRECKTPFPIDDTDTVQTLKQAC
jgi:hypothetical protein